MSEILFKAITPIAPRSSIARKTAASVTLALSLALAACASDGTVRDTGERLSDRGREIGTYGTAWSEGQKTVRDAEKAIDKSDRSRTDGERDLAKAREELARAEQKIIDASSTREAAVKRIEVGRAQMTQAEADYANAKAGPSVVTTEK